MSEKKEKNVTFNNIIYKCEGNDVSLQGRQTDVIISSSFVYKFELVKFVSEEIVFLICYVPIFTKKHMSTKCLSMWIFGKKNSSQ